METIKRNTKATRQNKALPAPQPRPAAAKEQAQPRRDPRYVVWRGERFI